MKLSMFTSKTKTIPCEVSELTQPSPPAKALKGA